MQLLLDSLINAVIQFAWIFGALFVSGFLLTWLARWTNNVHRQFVFPRLGLYLFGWLGVPVHELTHYLFCKTFRLEVKKVKWFDPKGRSGSHGAVEHLYEPWNLVHRVGHVFVGYAPVLLAPLFLAVLYFVLVPAASLPPAGFGILASRTPAAVGPFVQLAGGFVWLTSSLFATANVSSLGFWIFLYVAFAIAAHLDLSREDLKLAHSGLLALFFVIVAVNVGAALFGANLQPRFVRFGSHALSVWTLCLAATAAISALNLAVCWILMGAVNAICGRGPIRPF